MSRYLLSELATAFRSLEILPAFTVLRELSATVKEATSCVCYGHAAHELQQKYVISNNGYLRMCTCVLCFEWLLQSSRLGLEDANIVIDPGI